MPRKPAPQLPCKGCGAAITGYRRLYCTLECGQYDRNRLRAQKQLAARQLARKEVRTCSNPACENTFTGNRQRIYCSDRCNHLVNHRRPPRDKEIRLRSNKTAKNIEEAAPCSICGQSTARRGYYRTQSPILPMIPQGIELCTSHLRGYSFFVQRHQLFGRDPDEVFNSYLVHKTFVSSVRQSSVKMMVDAFHAAEH